MRKRKESDARSIKEYRLRRIQRLRARFDAEGDDDAPNGGNNGNGARRGSGGHGNTKIPFGLCEREGIKVDPKWSPRDAWEALEGKGYSAGDTYAELRKTGKVAKKGPVAPAKKPPTRIEEKHLPAELTSKAYKKNTMEFVEYVNSHCDDGNVTEFFSAATLPGGKPAKDVKCKRLASGEGCAIVTTMDRTTRVPTATEIRVPMLSKFTKPEERAEAIRSFCHEWTHYLDFLARDEDKFGHFTEKSKELTDAVSKFKKENMGEEVKGIFQEFNKRYDEAFAQYKAGKKIIPGEVAKAMFGDDRPEWLKSDGSVDYWSASAFIDGDRRKAYEATVKKAKKKWLDDGCRQRRALMDGVSCLQGIYEALSGGELQEERGTRYGHGKNYFKGNHGTMAVEAIADYVALKATRPELAAVFEKDQPEIARAMDNTLAAITKKLRGGVS